MSASVAPTAPVAVSAGVARPRFLILLRGELFKIIHLRITWVMAAIFTLLVVGSQLLLVSGPNTQGDLQRNPLGSFYNLMEGDLSIVRIFSGTFLLILTAHVIGLEYQQGTIRILLGRGVGRLHLLGAKVLAVLLIGLGIIAFEMLIEAIFGYGLVAAFGGNHHPASVLGAEYWTDVRFYLLCVLINAVATLLLGVAASVVGRSLAFGLAVGLSWFFVDNLATLPLSIMARFTHSDLWLKLSGLLLGPVLNRLPDEIAPPYHVTVAGPHGPVTITQAVSGFGILPLVTVPGSHALLVILAYSLVFAAVAVVLTRRREVLE